MTALYETRGAIALITLQNPPVNALGYATRLAIVEGLDRAADDPSIQAIVLTGEGKAFSGGADIREFGSPKATQEPNLLSVIAALEQSPKPVIAAIHSVCMGGGLELALGCHYRIAATGAQIALPEVKLGLLPGAGGTQRLPRLVGVETALNMIVKGDPVKSEKLADCRLFERVVEGDVVAAALEWAQKVIQEGSARPLVRHIPIDPVPYAGFFGAAKLAVASMSKGYPAPLRCVEAVENATKLSFDAGMKAEREAFMALMLTPESKALRHAFFGERAASSIADVPDSTPKRPITQAGVIGAGTMGGGITMNFVNAGIPVVLLETQEEALNRGLATIRKNYENSAKKGKLTAQEVEARLQLIKPTLQYSDLANADIIIEAVYEDIDVKKTVFEQLDAVAKPGAILASNTSTLDLNRIASFTKRPHDVVGMHFFSPANVMKLLEVVRGEHTAKDVLATVMSLSKKIRKTAVVSGVCDGFIGNRMIEQYLRQSLYLLEEGCTPAQVDKAMESWGMAMGPFRMGDLAGNDIGWYIRKRRYVERPDMKYPKIADKLCELGRFGQKVGKGWYDYVPGKRDAVPSSEVGALIEAHRSEIGSKTRKVSAEEIVDRLVFALVNEACAILEEGIAARASDIDMVYLTGYGFPLYRGGPMCYADTVGVYNVVRRMRQFAKGSSSDPTFWTPHPRLVTLAESGKSLIA